MDLQEILETMKVLQEEVDYEMAHYEADGLLCEALIKSAGSLGKEIVDAFHEVGKWYA